MRRAVAVLMATISVTSSAAAQSLAGRIAAVRDGTVRMSFAARPGVCGDGRGSVCIRNDAGTWNDRPRVCMAGPIRVSIGRSENQTVSVRTRVGGPWTAGLSETDLGNVPAVEAARYLTVLAHTIGGTSGDEALSAAAFADGFDLAPEFKLLIRDTEAPIGSRRQALFWLGQSDAPTRELTGLYDNLESFTLREHFAFVLSQRHDDASLDKLIDVARHDRDVEVRKQAMFWLGQSKDPKAVKFFRDLLTP